MLGNSVVFHGTFPAIRRKREGIHRGASQVVWQETSPDSMHSSRKPRRKAINLEALNIVCVTASIKSRLQFSFNLHPKSQKTKGLYSPTEKLTNVETIDMDVVGGVSQQTIPL